MNGNHTITAVVRDAAGNSATSAGITVTVNNAPASTAGTKTVLNVRSASSDGGYAWILLGKYGTPADNSSKPTRSTFGSLKTARSFARRTVCIAISAISAGVASATGAMSTAAASRCALPAPTTPLRARTAGPTPCAPAAPPPPLPLANERSARERRPDLARQQVIWTSDVGGFQGCR
jgi:hypothetical protein